MTWRSEYPVLVAEAHSLGALAVIRSLGTAGYPVIACAARSDAIGFRSRHARAALVHVNYNDPSFLPWLRETIARLRIQVIIPSEGLLLALRPVFAEFRHLLPVHRDERIVYGGMSKFDLFRAFGAPSTPDALRAHLPPFRLIDDGAPLPTAESLASLGTTLYAKGDACYAIDNGARGTVAALRRPETWSAELAQMRHRYSRLLVQGEVSGRGAGVFLLRHRGQILARFMHLRVHEVPHTGGVSSLRRSWWHPGMYADAARRIDFLDWEGVAMFEYRWDPQRDTFYLLEMNGRFWGSLHLALHAGVDFPRLLVDAFFGHPERREVFRRDVACRCTFPLEAMHVISRVRDHRLPLRARAGSVIEWFALGLDPRIKSDLWFNGDVRPYFAAFAQTFGDVVGGLWRRLPVRTLWGKRRRIAKLAFFYGCKTVGLFRFSSSLFRRHLHILCYHGIALTDEHRFRPGLFMRRELFARRLAWLKRHRYTIISLEEGLARLRAGTLARKTAVITIDDGFYSTGKVAAPLLAKHGFPATLYVTTYYVQHANPIFRLVVQYLFWKTALARFDTQAIVPGMSGVHATRGREAHALMERIIDYGERECSEDARTALSRELARRLDVDYEELVSSRRLSLLTPDELRALRGQGVDVQLHTHRHCLPLESDALTRELRDNRAVLEPIAGRHLEHLCYPSGIWSAAQWPTLAAAGVASATTCDAGPNAPDAPALGLRRALDRDGLAQIELEAELTGFAEMLRRARAWLIRLRTRAPVLHSPTPTPAPLKEKPR